MKCFIWTAVSSRLILLSVAMLVSVPMFAQTDFSGEWALRDNEVFESQGQPPLGDYLGIPFNDAGRLRAEHGGHRLLDRYVDIAWSGGHCELQPGTVHRCAVHVPAPSAGEDGGKGFRVRPFELPQTDGRRHAGGNW